MIRKAYRKNKKDETGQTIVEAALLLPLMLLILCGILDFGWIYANQYKVEEAAYSAARYGAINAGTVADDQLIRSMEDKAKTNLYGGGESAVVDVVLGEDSICVTVDCPVKTLTFVAGTFFGQYYNAVSTSVSSY